MVYEEGEKVSGDGGYIEKMRKLRKEANDAGANINDDQFKTTLLDSFPESWDSVISTLYAEKSLTVITAHLIAHSERVVGRKAVGGSTSTQGTQSKRYKHRSKHLLSKYRTSLSRRRTTQTVRTSLTQPTTTARVLVTPLKNVGS